MFILEGIAHKPRHEGAPGDIKRQVFVERPTRLETERFASSVLYEDKRWLCANIDLVEIKEDGELLVHTKKELYSKAPGFFYLPQFKEGDENE